MNFKEAFRLMMFRETQNYTNENLNVLKKHYNDNEGSWNQAYIYLILLV